MRRERKDVIVDLDVGLTKLGLRIQGIGHLAKAEKAMDCRQTKRNDGKCKAGTGP